MKLAQPTDFEILEQLADGKRNVASNLTNHLDKDRAYLNTRFPILHDYGLVKRIGPASSSGLYEITPKCSFNRGLPILP
jgi:hypothetical protein